MAVLLASVGVSPSFAQQYQCVGQGCPPTQASVQDLLDASRNNSRAGTPGISFAEGAANGFSQGMELRRQREELRQLQEQGEELQRLREQRESQAQSSPQTPLQEPQAPPTNTNPSTTQGLMERCKRGAQDPYDDGICDGFLVSWLQLNTHTRLGDIGKFSCGKFSYCIAKGTTINLVQTRAIFTQWAEKNPSKWHMESSMRIAEAMSEALPCPKEKKFIKRDAPADKTN